MKIKLIGRFWVALCLCALAGAAFSQERCGIAPALMQSGFERGEQPPAATLPPDTTALTLIVDSPLEGATINGNRLQIYGSFTGPANTGITVNDALYATTNATKFTSAPMTLANGPQVLTITAKTMDGATQTIVRNVTVNVSGVDPVKFTSPSRGGYAPFRARFDLSTQPPAGQTAAVRFELDYDGDGLFDSDTTNPPIEPTYEYAAAGVFLARARVSFDDGQAPTPLVIREGTFRIQTDLLAFTRQTLCSVYYEMKRRLVAGQIVQAGNTLSPEIRSKFLTIWNAQAATLPATAGRLGEIVAGQLADVSAEFLVGLPLVGSPGQFLGFPLMFSRSTDGVWRITGM
jgi:hypothetical protein